MQLIHTPNKQQRWNSKHMYLSQFKYQALGTRCVNTAHCLPSSHSYSFSLLREHQHAQARISGMEQHNGSMLPSQADVFFYPSNNLPAGIHPSSHSIVQEVSSHHTCIPGQQLEETKYRRAFLPAKSTLFPQASQKSYTTIISVIGSHPSARDAG